MELSGSEMSLCWPTGSLPAKRAAGSSSKDHAAAAAAAASGAACASRSINSVRLQRVPHQGGDRGRPGVCCGPGVPALRPMVSSCACLRVAVQNCQNSYPRLWPCVSCLQQLIHLRRGSQLCAWRSAAYPPPTTHACLLLIVVLKGWACSVWAALTQVWWLQLGRQAGGAEEFLWAASWGCSICISQSRRLRQQCQLLGQCFEGLC